MGKIFTHFSVLILMLLFAGSSSALFAQIMTNYGSTIYSNNDTIFAVGGVWNAKENVDLGTNGGTFRNSGELYFTGDWKNTAGNTAFTNTANTNDNSQITCYMIGGNQSIIGQNQNSNITHFHNLVLLGTGVKQLFDIDALVLDTLRLNDKEFATGTYHLSVTNTDPNAIELTSGFVSSLDGGYLKRNTATTSRYLFPVGSSLNTFRYRPIEIRPENNFPNEYAVRMANVNPTSEGYNINTKDALISSVNQYYYHQITRESGLSKADITVYYMPGVDGPVSGIGHWQHVPQWEDIHSDHDANNYGYSAVTRLAWDFSLPSPAFALMKLYNECGEMFVPNAFSPDGNGENDLECVYGKCVQELYFAIYDRWGEKVFETTNISKCWDGTFRGQEMNTAVFVYYMKAKLTTGETVEKKGNISLLR